MKQTQHSATKKFPLVSKVKQLSVWKIYFCKCIWRVHSGNSKATLLNNLNYFNLKDKTKLRKTSILCLFVVCITKSRSWSRIRISASANCLSFEVLGHGTCLALKLKNTKKILILKFKTYPSQTLLIISCNLLPLKNIIKTDLRVNLPWK